MLARLSLFGTKKIIEEKVELLNDIENGEIKKIPPLKPSIIDEIKACIEILEKIKQTEAQSKIKKYRYLIFLFSLVLIISSGGAGATMLAALIFRHKKNRQELLNHNNELAKENNHLELNKNISIILKQKEIELAHQEFSIAVEGMNEDNLWRPANNDNCFRWHDAQGNETDLTQFFGENVTNQIDDDGCWFTKNKLKHPLAACQESAEKRCLLLELLNNISAQLNELFKQIDAVDEEIDHSKHRLAQIKSRSLEKEGQDIVSPILFAVTLIAITLIIFTVHKICRVRREKSNNVIDRYEVSRFIKNPDDKIRMMNLINRLEKKPIDMEVSNLEDTIKYLKFHQSQIYGKITFLDFAQSREIPPEILCSILNARISQ